MKMASLQSRPEVGHSCRAAHSDKQRAHLTNKPLAIIPLEIASLLFSSRIEASLVGM